MAYTKEAYENCLEVHDAVAHDQLKVGPGTLAAIIINDPGTTWVIPIYDDAGTGTTKLMATLKPTAAGTLKFNARFGRGLRIAVGSGTPGSLTIVWE